METNNQIAVIVTADEFKRSNSVPACMRKYGQVNSLVKAINSGAETLAKINKTYGREFVESYIQMWIININEFLNYSRMMSENQIIETSMLVYDEYYFLNIAEIKMIFTDVKKGLYGNLYEGIDGLKILSWFKKYYEKRMEHFESNLESESSHNRLENNDYQRTSTLNHNKEVAIFKEIAKWKDESLKCATK